MHMPYVLIAGSKFMLQNKYNGHSKMLGPRWLVSISFGATICIAFINLLFRDLAIIPLRGVCYISLMKGMDEYGTGRE